MGQYYRSLQRDTRPEKEHVTRSSHTILLPDLLYRPNFFPNLPCNPVPPPHHESFARYVDEQKITHQILLRRRRVTLQGKWYRPKQEKKANSILGTIKRWEGYDAKQSSVRKTPGYYHAQSVDIVISSN